MIVTLDQLKGTLGISVDDVSHDAALTNALMMANGLLASYIGYDVSDATTVREYSYSPLQYGPRDFIHLPLWPIIEVLSVVDENGAPIPVITYRVVRDMGRLDFPGGVPQIELITVQYRAGFDVVPPDLLPPGLNIAAAIYNNGGQFGAGNALKSLTMFDAMSMSFDTAAGAASPDSFVNAWSFVLDKYSVKKGPVLK